MVILKRKNLKPDALTISVSDPAPVTSSPVKLCFRSWSFKQLQWWRLDGSYFYSLCSSFLDHSYVKQSFTYRDRHGKVRIRSSCWKTLFRFKQTADETLFSKSVRGLMANVRFSLNRLRHLLKSFSPVSKNFLYANINFHLK